MKKLELYNAFIAEDNERGKNSKKFTYRPRMGQSDSWTDNEVHIANQSKAHVKAINEITRKELNDIMEESKGISDDEMPSLLKKNSLGMDTKYL